MKKIIIIIGAIVLLGSVAAGGFYAGITYQSNLADQARANFESMRGQGNPGEFPQDGQNLPEGMPEGGMRGGQFPGGFGGAGTTGQVKSIDGDVLMLSTAQDVTTVHLSDTTQVQQTVTVDITQLQPGMRIMVTGEAGADGVITASQIRILTGDPAASTPLEKAP